MRITSKSVWKFSQGLALAAGFLVIFTGCETVENYSLTYRLWDNSDLRKFSEPAPEPNLALFESTNRADVLVQYDALSEKHSTVTRSSYFLRPNQARVAAGKKPRWLDPAVTNGMQSIPVLSAPAAVTNQSAERTIYAVTIREGRGFSLNGPDGAQQTFALPVYAETSGTITRVVLTPFAVAGDTVMVGGVVAVVGFFLWAQSVTTTHY